MSACNNGKEPEVPPEEEQEWLDENKTQTYNFYLDYNNVETPIYTMKWWQYRPLGECPEEAKLTNADAFDELFPVFLGYSLYPSSIDDSHLWNFKTDYRASITVNLYGIWVAED